jgi:1,4-dihydroxy-2-naphthoate octaprenyltransferase
MTTSQPPTRTQVWLMAIRPKTLPAAIGPVLAGLGLAARQKPLDWPVAVLTLVTALLLQIGVNLANDVQDYEKGADTVGERLGPPRVTALGLISPHAMWRATWLTFGLALLLGLYLVKVGGWPILAIGLSAILAALAYTGGPFPIAYHGLGEVFVFLYFGLFAVVGTYWLQAHRAPALAWWAGAWLGMLNAAILVVNNTRDLENDRRAGKRTLSVRLGPKGSRWEYALLMALPYLLPIPLVLLGRAPWGVLLVWLSAPMAFVAARQIFRLEGRALNALLALTGKLVLLYGGLLALGAIVS